MPLPSLYKSEDSARAWNVTRAAGYGALIGALAALFKTLGPLRASAAPGSLTDNLAGSLAEIAGAALAFCVALRSCRGITQFPCPTARLTGKPIAGGPRTSSRQLILPDNSAGNFGRHKRICRRFPYNRPNIAVHHERPVLVYPSCAGVFSKGVSCLCIAPHSSLSPRYSPPGRHRLRPPDAAAEGIQAPVVYAPAGCGGCGTPTAAFVYAQPVAPAPPPPPAPVTVSTWAWGTGCGCRRAVVYAAPSVEPMPIAPAPIYVVNQGPDYTGPGSWSLTGPGRRPPPTLRLRLIPTCPDTATARPVARIAYHERFYGHPHYHGPVRLWRAHPYHPHG